MTVAGSIVAVVGSYWSVRTGVATRLDGAAHRVLAGHHGPRADRVVAVATDVGSVYALAGVVTACVATRRRGLALELAAAGSVAWLGAQAAKPLLVRSRPYEDRGATRLVALPAGSSWPSGHAALMAAMADAVGSRGGTRTRAALALATGGVGLSRCYVGVHHLSDVVAGIGVGLLASRTTRRLLRHATTSARPVRAVDHRPVTTR